MTTARPHALAGPRPLAVPRALAVPLAAALALALAAAPVAHADTAPSAEAEHLVPPQGGAVEVALHAGAVCILSFPEKLATKALTSSPDYEIKGWGDDGVAVRAIKASAAPATLALATASGAIKVNVTIRVVPATQPAQTMVRFKAASSGEAFRAAVAVEVERQTAALAAELAAARTGVDALIRDRADHQVARRLLARLETVALRAHARNADHVIVHVDRAVFLGEDAYLLFRIENRSGAAYRLATVDVTGPGGTRHAGPASLLSSAVDAEAGLVGVVAAGGRGRGVVVLRQVDEVLGKSVTVTLAGPDGRGRIAVTRGVVLR